MSGPVSYTSVATSGSGDTGLDVNNTTSYFLVSSSLPTRFRLRGLNVMVRGNSYSTGDRLTFHDGETADPKFVFFSSYNFRTNSVVVPQDSYVLISSGLYVKVNASALQGAYFITVFF